jgi:hypothetical protein
MAKHLSTGDFPRTRWGESIGLRNVFMRAFNTSRTNKKRLEAMQTWLRFMTKRTNEALLEIELEAERKAGGAKEATPPLAAATPTLAVPALAVPVLTVPQLRDV